MISLPPAFSFKKTDGFFFTYLPLIVLLARCHAIKNLIFHITYHGESSLVLTVALNIYVVWTVSHTQILNKHSFQMFCIISPWYQISLLVWLSTFPP